jgi:peroxiredoxin Q/BCP
MSHPLSVGQPFPSFALPNQDGQPMRLAEFAGSWLVIFVYPKDDTPGCTVESRAFSSALPSFEKQGARVVGLSADSVDSHLGFCRKFDLKTPLLADVQGTLLSAMGVGQSDFQGTLYWNRETFLIDPRGILRKIYRDVKPQGHEAAVLADLTALAASDAS